MFRVSKTLSAFVLVACLWCGSLSTAAEAGSATTDPSGDVKSQTPGYLDITRTEVALNDGTFAFTMQVASQIPEVPDDPAGGLGWLEWLWALDANTSSSPQGSPFPSSTPSIFEFFPVVVWDGESFGAFVVDRRPLLTGSEPGLLPANFSIDGETVVLTVDATALDSPSSFEWASATEHRHSHWGSNGFSLMDIAPDSGLIGWEA